MKLKTKQRVIGGLVFLAILAIFIPILFHNSKFAKQPKIMTTAQTPPRQPSMALTMPAKTPVIIQSDQANQANQANQASQASQASQSSSSLSFSLDKAPKAWVVQLASFANKQNANQLISKLRQAKFDAYLRTSTSKNGQALSQVFVGPETSYQKSQQVQSELLNLFNLTGVIRRYRL